MTSTTPVITAANATIKVKKSGDTATQEIAITGENLTGQKLGATLNPTIEGLRVDLQSDVIEGGLISTTATLTYTETKDVPKNTTTLTLSDGVTSKEFTITYLAKITYSELETINEATTWDFKTAVTGGVDFSNTDDAKVEYVYADIADFEDLTFTEAFNAKALSFKGQFPFRPGNKFAQNGVLRFKTLYPGKVDVTFSNTGNADDKEENYRYAKVNGIQGTKETHTTTEVTESFYVGAGDVIVEGTNSLRYYKIVFTPVTSTEIKIDNGKGYRTFASKYPTNWSDAAAKGITAYTANINDNEVSFTEVSGVVPAGEGLLLKGEDGTYTIPTATTVPAAFENAFVGVTAQTEVEGSIFVLYDGEQGVGFYKTMSEKFTVGANTAYIPAVAGARTFISLDGETTGIDAAIVNNDKQTNDVYNLNGQRVAQPTKGLYIVNGKKVIIK